MEMGEQYYAESGNLMKLKGVLRATDMHWNPSKRYRLLKFDSYFHTVSTVQEIWYLRLGTMFKRTWVGLVRNLITKKI